MQFTYNAFDRQKSMTMHAHLSWIIRIGLEHTDPITC